MNQTPEGKAKAKSWRDWLRVHPAADLFPLMAPDEQRALGEDIKQHGLRSPIVLWADAGDPTKARGKWQLLDGRNRLDAMELIGIPLDNDIFQKATTAKYLFSEDDPYAYVISANIHRRHLTAEQKRELIAKLIKADPTKSNRQIADQVKVSHPHVAKVRAGLETTGDVETVTTSIDTKGRRQPRRKPAAHITAAVERAVARSEENERRQASLDPQELADRRKAEVAQADEHPANKQTRRTLAKIVEFAAEGPLPRYLIISAVREFAKEVIKAGPDKGGLIDVWVDCAKRALEIVAERDAAS